MRRRLVVGVWATMFVLALAGATWLVISALQPPAGRGALPDGGGRGTGRAGVPARGAGSARGLEAHRAHFGTCMGCLSLVCCSNPERHPLRALGANGSCRPVTKG